MRSMLQRSSRSGQKDRWGTVIGSTTSRGTVIVVAWGTVIVAALGHKDRKIMKMECL